MANFQLTDILEVQTQARDHADMSMGVVTYTDAVIGYNGNYYLIHIVSTGK